MLRVTVHVPQANAFAIHDGLLATAYLPQKPEQTFSGKIARSSVALLNSARTLDTEVDVDNPDRCATARRLRQRLLRRAAPASQRDPARRGADLRPARPAGRSRQQDSEVHLQPISIYRDFGATVELRDGLNGGEQVVVNPPVDLHEHMKVKVKPLPPEKQAEK